MDKGEETETDRQKHEQWVVRFHLDAESDRLQKVHYMRLIAFSPLRVVTHENFLPRVLPGYMHAY